MESREFGSSLSVLCVGRVRVLNPNRTEKCSVDSFLDVIVLRSTGIKGVDDSILYPSKELWTRYTIVTRDNLWRLARLFAVR